MLTTFDRYLIGRFLFVFAVFLGSLYGLFVVIDCFTNVDSFFPGRGGDTTAGLLSVLPVSVEHVF